MLYTTKEAATLLRCHPHTIRRLVADGELIAYRLGNRLRIDNASISTFLKGEHNGSNDPEKR